MDMADDDPFAPSTGSGHSNGVSGLSSAEYSLRPPPAPTTSGAPATTEGATPKPPDAPAGTEAPADADKFHGTPIKNSINTHAYDPVTGKQRGPFLAGQGGMGPRFCQYSVKQFFEKLPGSSPTKAQRKTFKGANFKDVRLEKDIYPLLTGSIDSTFKAALAKHVRVLETPRHRAQDGHNGRTDTLNDVGIYLNNEAAVKATTLDAVRRAKSKIDEKELAEHPHLGLRSWHWLAIPIEVKHDLAQTAFEFHDPPKPSPAPDPAKRKKRPAKAPPPANASAKSGASDASTEQESPKAFIRSSSKGEAALAQFVEYMLNVFDNQHRIFSYACYVYDHLARLCYFDRGGAVVSEEFNWTTPDSPLHDFFWRVAKMSKAELGYDQTAKHVKDDNDKVKLFKKMRSSPAVPEEIRPFVEQAVSDGYPIYKVTIIPMAAPADEGFPDDPFPPPPPPDSSSPTPSDPAPPTEPKARSFLIGKPHFSACSLVGRCTRGYIAYDMDNDRLCFLKDYWRPYVPNRTRPEHLVYERMARCGVTGVPTLICGGDVDGLRAQETQAQNTLHHLGNAKPVPRIHYRLATVEIGVPLESFRNFRELALVFADAVYAHYLAWNKAKVMQRDISIGNILIVPGTREGLLIDWDLARVECELASGPTEPERTGTWPFRSALAVNFPRKPHRLSDDLEAFIHSFDFLVLKYHPTNRRALRSFITNTYEDYALVGERKIRVGGDAKLAQIISPSPPFGVFDNEALQNVLNQLHKGCYESYGGVDLGQMERLYGVGVRPKPQPTVPKSVPAVNHLNPARRRHKMLLHAQGSNPPAPPSTDRATAPTQSQSSTSQAQTTSATCTTQSESAAASDPCELQGFLAGHADLLKVLLAYEEEAEVDDKHPDQFKLRKDENAIVVPERSQTQGISSMSMPTGSDLGLNLGVGSETTSVGVPRPPDITKFLKRARSDDEDAEDGDAGSQAGPSTAQPRRQSVVSRMRKRQVR